MSPARPPALARHHAVVPSQDSFRSRVPTCRCRVCSSARPGRAPSRLHQILTLLTGDYLEKSSICTVCSGYPMHTMEVAGLLAWQVLENIPPAQRSITSRRHSCVFILSSGFCSSRSSAHLSPPRSLAAQHRNRLSRSLPSVTPHRHRPVRLPGPKGPRRDHYRYPAHRRCRSTGPYHRQVRYRRPCDEYGKWKISRYPLGSTE